MKAKSTLILMVLLLSFISCDDSKLDKVNPNQLSLETFYRSGAQAEAAVNAIYSALQANNLYNRFYFFKQDLLSDDVQSGGAQLGAEFLQLLIHDFDGANPTLLANWRGLYRVVHRANLVLENVPNTTDDITENLRNRLLGEAYFLRAWANFELVSQWGDIPLMSSAATTPEANPKSAQSAVYELIFNDLSEAINKLPSMRSYSGADVGRVGKTSAQALAAKVHLFRNNHAAAKPFLEAIIASNDHKLMDRYLDNFEEENENNEESLFEVQFSEAFGAAGGWNADGSSIAEVTFRGQEYGPTAWRNLIPSDELVAAYETVAGGAAKDDPRNSYNFFRIGDLYNNGESVLTVDKVQGDVTKPSWRKYQTIYKRVNENVQSGINFRVIRYADVLLMMAEVENELSGPAAALPFINQVRARADVDMPPYPTAQYPTNTKQEMLRAIIHERQVEFAGEQIRNKDIRRWRRAGALDAEPIKNWQARYDLLPIPLQEIDNNSALTNADQNPGF
jgi:starch-binding outer membrane protein, SusD/RagB family